MEGVLVGLLEDLRSLVVCNIVSLFINNKTFRRHFLVKIFAYVLKNVTATARELFFCFTLALLHFVYIFKYVFTSGDDWFENLRETSALACKMITSGFLPWLKNVACLSSLLKTSERAWSNWRPLLFTPFYWLVSYVVDLNASTNDVKILNHSFDGTFQKL